jgi:hypothetical protein
MLEAGAINMIAVASPPSGQDRFDAYVALSPEGPGIVFPDRAWRGIHKPMLWSLLERVIRRYKEALSRGKYPGMNCQEVSQVANGWVSLMAPPT